MPTCRSAGFDVVVIEPQDLNISHTTPLDERPATGEALRLVEAGQLQGIAVSSHDRIGTLALTRESKARLLSAGAVLKVADTRPPFCAFSSAQTTRSRITPAARTPASVRASGRRRGWGKRSSGARQALGGVRAERDAESRVAYRPDGMIVLAARGLI